MIDAAKERALAGAARADHADDLAAMNVERDALQHLERAEALVEFDDADRRRRHGAAYRPAIARCRASLALLC